MATDLSTTTAPTSEESNHSSNVPSNVKRSRIPRKVPPPFSVQRLFKSMSQTNPQQPISIKQDNTAHLEKMSLDELKELLKKQDKLIQNKKLLSNLKDKGEKMIAFRQKIAEEIKSREELMDAENMMEKLKLNSGENNTDQPKFVNHYLKILQKPTTINPRFNVPQKTESTIQISNLKEQDFKQVKIKLNLPKEVKTLDIQESLQSLETANLKNKHAMAEQILRFREHRSAESDSDEFDGDDSCDDEEQDYALSDDDLHVNVNSTH